MAPKKKKSHKKRTDETEPLAEALKGLLNVQSAAHATLAENMQTGVKNSDLLDAATASLNELRGREDKNCELLTGKISAQQKKLEEEADEELARKFLLQKLGLSKGVKLDDGDQSPLKGDKAQVLRNQWGNGMDYNPENDHLSDWMKSLYRGDYDAVMKLINSQEKEKMGMLLEVRESMMNVSAIFHVIIGARTLCGRNPLFRDAQMKAQQNSKVKFEHQKILDKLIELGANIQAKDVAGYTPLHHCLTTYSNPTTLSMARQLLKAGADPNMKNRFGCTPLMEPVMAANMEALKLLLEYGADPDIKENDAGLSCRYLATMFPLISELFSKADKKKAKQSRANARTEAGGSLRLCKVCGEDKETKRCTGCYMVMYCGQKCQMADWPKHMVDCKVTRAQYKLVKLVEYEMAGKDNITKEIYVHKVGDLPSQKHFVVKVQVPLGHQSTGPSPDAARDPLFVYNRDRSLCGYLLREAQVELYDMLVRNIRMEGFNGQKGFYYAIYSGPSKDSTGKSSGDKEATVEIKINPEIMLPVEKW